MRRQMVTTMYNNINYWPTPAESPDLNPIEMLWNKLKFFLSTVVKQRNKELVDGIRTFWSTRVTPEVSALHRPLTEGSSRGDQARGKSIRGCVENEDPKTKTEDRRPCGLKRRPCGLKRRPTGLKRRPCGLKRRPTGLKPFFLQGKT